MNKKRTLYIFIVSLIAFLLWVIGEAIIIYFDLTVTIERIWIIAIFGAACAWNAIHFHRTEKKQKEDEENENYKGVY